MSTPNPYGAVGPIVPLGVNSPEAQGEWDTFLRRRQQLLDQGMQQIHLTGQLQGQGLAPRDAHQMATVMTESPLVADQETAGPVQSHEYTQLLGAAEFYQIPGVDKLPPEQLRQLVEEKRGQLTAHRMASGELSLGARAYDALATTIGVAGIGAVDAAIEGLKGVPFLGDAMRKSASLQNYQQGLSMFEEGFTGDMLDNERAVYDAVAKPLSHLLGYGIVATGVGEAVGASGFAGGVANPIIRAGLQGAATGTILEGGRDIPLADRIERIGEFGAVGAGAAAIAPLAKLGWAKFAGRVRSSFQAGIQDAAENWRAPGDVNAEWSWENNAAQVPEQRLLANPGLSGEVYPPTGLSPGPRLLGPGPIDSTGGWADPLLPPGSYPMGPVQPRGLDTGQMPAGTFEVSPGYTSVRGDVPRAVDLAAGASKAATILESPLAPAQAQQPNFDDGDVALSALARAPGQISVIENVGDVGKVVRSFVQNALPNGVGPQDFRAVPRPAGGTDILVADGRPLSNKVVRQYQEFGMFEGQRAATSAGQDVQVVRLGPEISTVRTAGGLEVQHPTRELIPARNSSILDVAPSAYGSMRNFAIMRMAQESAGAGLDSHYVKLTGYPDIEQYGGSLTDPQTRDWARKEGFGRVPNEATVSKNTIPGELPWRATFFENYGQYVPSVHEAFSTREEAAAFVRNSGDFVPKIANWFGDELATQLPRYIDEFLDTSGINAPALRATYKGLFTEMRVREFKTLAPEHFAQADAGLAAVNAEHAVQQAVDPRPLSVDEVAESKGLVWEPAPNTMGGQLRDAASGQVVPLDDREAAYAYLQHFNREVPDWSPASTVPAELATEVAGVVSPGLSVGPEHQMDSEELAHAGMRNLSEIQGLWGGGGGGDLPPDAPTLRGPGGTALPPGASRGPTFGSQMERLRYSNPGKYNDLMANFDSLTMNTIEPLRNWALRAEEAFHQAGVTEGRLWDYVSNVQNMRSVAHNEAVPWHTEINEALAKIPRRFIRNGTVTLIGELSPGESWQAMAREGYTDKAIEGQFALRELFDRLHAEYQIPGYIPNYMPHLRAAAARGENISPELDAMFGGPGTFWAEQIREGSIDVREMNASVLMHKWVRAATFNRYVADPVREMQRVFVDDPRIPASAKEEIRRPVSEWLQLVKTGHTPGQDVVIPGIRRGLNLVGVPVTNREVARGINWAMTNLYRGKLGLRPDVILRDMIGPLFAAPRVGFGAIAQSYTQFLKSDAIRSGMMELGLRGGWVERGMVPTGASEMFETGIGMVPGAPVPDQGFSRGQQVFRESVARVGDMVHDALPERFRSGTQGTLADPLYGYTKLGEFNRLISGHAGWMAMDEALANYVGSGKIQGAAIADLLKDSGAFNYAAPIQRKIVGAVQAGDFESARNIFANEVANSQFRYGTIEAPALVRKSGIVGRMGSTFGTFTTQYVAQMREGLTTGGMLPEYLAQLELPPVQMARTSELEQGLPLARASYGKAGAAARFAAGHLLIGGALGAATAATGWNLGKWFWHGSLGWGGGPMLVSMVTKMSELSGKYNNAIGQSNSPIQRWAVQQSERENPYDPGFLAGINPYQGGVNTLNSLGQTLGSSNPLENTASFLVTGRTDDPAFLRQMNNSVYQFTTPDGIQRQGGVPEQYQQQGPPMVTTPLYPAGGGAGQ